MRCPRLPAIIRHSSVGRFSLQHQYGLSDFVPYPNFTSLSLNRRIVNVSRFRENLYSLSSNESETRRTGSLKIVILIIFPHSVQILISQRQRQHAIMTHTILSSALLLSLHPPLL